MNFERGACRSCPTPVIWASTVKGKAMPVDAEPHPDGNVRLTARPGQAPLAEVVAPGQDGLLDGEPLRHSHFTTCPEAGKHRRPR